MKISVIIVTYNYPKALELILNSILTQKELPYEVIIADDGSTPETAHLIKKYKTIFPIDVKHVWHEDKGFRGAKIRNEAIKIASGDYLIFSDGDLLLHPCFFYDYRVNSTKGAIQIGSRVFLSQLYTQDALNSLHKKFSITFYSSKIEKNRLNSIRIPWLIKLFSEKEFSERLRGGLLGVWKTDMMFVNGWNEDFVGWGKEDTELIARLASSGVKIRKLKFAGITYHLWHSFAPRDQLSINEELLRETIKDKHIKCRNGIEKVTV